MPRRPEDPPSATRLFLKSNKVLVAALSGYIVALGFALVGFVVVDNKRSDAAMARFGQTTAEDLAYLALDPLLRDDRIGLGLLTNRLAARQEVRGIAIHATDEAPVVVAGIPASPTSPTYTHPIGDRDTAAGQVSVHLNPDSFALPFKRVVAGTLPFALAGFALTGILAFFGNRLVAGEPIWRRPPALPMPPRAFVVVAELATGRPPKPLERDACLAHARAVGERVASHYGGDFAALPDKGVVLVFPLADSKDRCFDVVCAALLLRRLLATSRSARPEHHGPLAAGTESAGSVDAGRPPMFRYGLDFAESGVVLQDHTVKATAVADVLLLASLAKPGELVIGRAAYKTLDNPDRISLDALGNPATVALASGVAMPHGKIVAISHEYDSLITDQTATIRRMLDE